MSLACSCISTCGPFLSIFVISIVFVSMFPAISLTFIIIPVVFWVYVLVDSVCHVVPPSKLYASSGNPLSVSVAVIDIVTSSFVHSVGLPDISNVGAVTSFICFCNVALLFVPSVNLA